MPKEHKKRGRREEKKRKRGQEDEFPTSKRPKSNKGSEADIIVDHDPHHNGADYLSLEAPGEIPFYGLLDEEEQEYFKRADTILELNQFNDAEEWELFLANVYQEASGKELKIASSQSCSRLMERLILMSTPEQLKVLFRTFSGHFLNLAQHRFASHCCEALFLQAAPLVTKESKELTRGKARGLAEESTTAESLFLNLTKELEQNLGYLMTDRFASHTLRVLLVVLSGRPLADAHTTTLLQSKKKENIKLPSPETTSSSFSNSTRTVPASFPAALDRMMKGIVAGLDTNNLRALASHPVANPLLQLLLDIEFGQFGKSKAKDLSSLFRKLLPDDPPREGTESASFFNAMLYDAIGSRLMEVLLTNSPGKTFKVLYQNLLRDRLPSLAKNETASYVLIKALGRLNKEDLQQAVEEICPQTQLLVDRSRTSVIRCLVERCQVREVDPGPLAISLKEAYGQQPAERLSKMLQTSLAATETMSEEGRKNVENQDPTKAHASLLAQSMLEAPGPLRDMVTEGILAMDNSILLQLAKDRSATRVLQKSLTCSSDTARYRRMIMPRLAAMTVDLTTDPVGSHVVDAFWTGSESLPFIREKIAQHLIEHEATLRDSIPGRAVWRNWKMDMYKTKRRDWVLDAKGQTAGIKTGIELARERYAAQKQGGQTKGRGQGQRIASTIRTGANAVVTAGQG
ncbi:MAG: hypothetical protein LQ343_002278 [Gyalolechia ehrenbergii]|nr:MAG: hypothetical protein LQ343_002278 [Gyalolechia ehrenbergii]